MHIQVLSPHFDDASLSCGQHILNWLSAGHDVEVVTVFTEFDAVALSPDSQEFMQKCGVKTGKEFHHLRGAEDKESLRQLGVKKFEWLGMTDGGFREKNGSPVYETHDLLFAGKVLDGSEWQEKVRKTLRSVTSQADIVVVPLGVGRHADHLLVRDLLQQIVPQNQLLFYVDIPYAFQFSNWKLNQVVQCCTQPHSLVWPSSKKSKAVQAYTSQVPVLFLHGFWDYPEVVVGEGLRRL